jgi:hypothetical protein
MLPEIGQKPWLQREPGSGIHPKSQSMKRIVVKAGKELY